MSSSPHPKLLELDLDALGMGKVLVDGEQASTSEVHIKAVAGHPTQVKLVVPALMVRVRLDSPQGRYEVTCPVGISDGRPVIETATAWTLGDALRDLATQSDRRSEL